MHICDVKFLCTHVSYIMYIRYKSKFTFHNKVTLCFISEKNEKSYPLLVYDLYKFYNNKIAVRGLNFIVKKQECFGLLGVNGAGKTSTFQMIAANLTITGGTIKIDGIDIKGNESEYRYRFGYCPQTDCLNEFMTAYQTLFYMAKLRGVSDSAKANQEVLYWLEQLDLQKYKDIKVCQYSGGTKRKLNAAMAMVNENNARFYLDILYILFTIHFRLAALRLFCWMNQQRGWIQNLVVFCGNA